MLTLALQHATNVAHIAAMQSNLCWCCIVASADQHTAPSPAVVGRNGSYMQNNDVQMCKTVPAALCPG